MRPLRFLLALLAFAAAVTVARHGRDEALERVKDWSDVLVSGALRATSQFGSELTVDGWADQSAYRQRRLRYLR